MSQVMVDSRAWSLLLLAVTVAARVLRLVKIMAARWTCYRGAGRKVHDMILEIAKLEVLAGLTSEFESAFAQAQTIIASMPGYQRHELRRCFEQANRYLLLVWWDSIESHTVGFRGSAQYLEWKALLHHFYDPFPTVEHYESIAGLP